MISDVELAFFSLERAIKTSNTEFEHTWLLGGCELFLLMFEDVLRYEILMSQIFDKEITKQALGEIPEIY